MRTRGVAGTLKVEQARRLFRERDRAGEEKEEIPNPNFHHHIRDIIFEQARRLFYFGGIQTVPQQFRLAGIYDKASRPRL